MLLELPRKKEVAPRYGDIISDNRMNYVIAKNFKSNVAIDEEKPYLLVNLASGAFWQKKGTTLDEIQRMIHHDRFKVYSKDDYKLALHQHS